VADTKTIVPKQLGIANARGFTWYIARIKN